MKKMDAVLSAEIREQARIIAEWDGQSLSDSPRAQRYLARRTRTAREVQSVVERIAAGEDQT